MSADKYPSKFSQQIEAIVYVFFTLYGYITNSQRDEFPLDCSVGRALHRYHRDNGFESRLSGLIFFQALISRILKLFI